MGTTWLFNVLRAMADAAETPLGVVADGVEPPPASWTGPIIVKSHRADSPALLSSFDSSADLRSIVMMRDPEAALASLQRTQRVDLEELIGWLEADFSSYEVALPVMSRVAVIREEWVAPRGAEIIGQLASLLELGLREEQVASIADEFSRDRVRDQVAQLEKAQAWRGEFTEYDRQTQWHAGHIGPDGPRTVELSDSLRVRVAALRSSIDDLVDQFGLWEASWPRSGAGSPAGAQAFITARAQEIAARSPQPSLVSRVLGRLHVPGHPRG